MARPDPAAVSSACMVASPVGVISISVCSGRPAWRVRRSPRMASRRPARVISVGREPSSSASSSILASRCSPRASSTRISVADSWPRSNSASTRSSARRAVADADLSRRRSPGRRAGFGPAELSVARVLRCCDVVTLLVRWSGSASPVEPWINRGWRQDQRQWVSPCIPTGPPCRRPCGNLGHPTPPPGTCRLSPDWSLRPIGARASPGEHG